MADPVQQTTDTFPKGNRKGSRSDEESNKDKDKDSGNGNGDKKLVPTSGLEKPGETKEDNEKESLKIKIHLNLHAKVKLDLDAQLYGDIVIGLL
ncbi:uncharacterized protein EURHEDRAFT_386341 [Aspergillus ruber CBS 135680]|uniref:Uncharacterized protein n=1 Tax=Aspergillus ruber (strain CBS 135680) TaxID=1388766 RepID=A0A017SEN7_ASPRC|nr:uncharacterized protein EURHEDRAFT_386341 [Aspergillus ruber CBS 135680]EYE95478.1 hypothetical protein EURHEDRAFT_386341 [Aspergillus ruber CBS 135680]